MADFDPYLQWLGIRSPERPPNHYRLLGVEPFESDASVIETAADRQMAHVRTFQQGKDADLSQQILNELATAKICLLDGKSKFEYDTALKQKYFNDPPPVDPATIDIKPTSSRVSAQNADQQDVEIEIDDDSFQLSRPKRSSRSAKSRVLIGMVIGLVVVGGVIYQFGPVANLFFRDSIVKDPQASNPPSSTEPVDEPRPLPPSDDGQAPTNTADESSDADETQDEERDNDATPPPEHVAVNPIRPRQDVPTKESAPWDQVAKRTPFSYQAGNPLESFVIAISGRDLESSRVILDSHARASSLGSNFATQLEPLVTAHEQFWDAVAEAIDELRMATELQFRGQTVQVVGRKNNAIQLQAANGERKGFTTDQVSCDPDVAISLVLHRFRNNPQVAWRLIGSFMSVDKEGDVDQAWSFWQRAELNGVAVSPDLRAFTFLSQVAGAELRFPLPTGTAASTPEESKTAPEPTPVEIEPRKPVPGKNASRAARAIVRKDLAPFFDNRTEQGKVVLATELLNRATQDRLKPVYTYALLDTARQIGTELKRPDIVLKSLTQIARAYDVDLQQEANSDLSSHSSNSESKAIAIAAVELGDEMIRENEFGLAENLLQIATDRLQSAPDATAAVETFRSRLAQSKEISRNAAIARRTLLTNSKDPQANFDIAIDYFMRREFKEGLTYLLRCDHSELQTLAMADLTTAETSRPDLSLAVQWETMAEEFDGVTKSGMRARAVFWKGD